MRLIPRRKLRPSWKYATAGILWQVCPTSHGKLIGEERDVDRKRVSFFCLDQESGKVLWEKKNFGEEWWMGIEGVKDDVLLLHGYATPDLPAHKGIVAVQTHTGNTLWIARDLTFLSFGESLVFASKQDVGGLRCVGLNLADGSITAQAEADGQGAVAREAAPTGGEPVYPSRFTDPDELPPGVRDVVRRHSGTRMPDTPVEAIEDRDAVVFDFREAGGTTGKAATVLVVAGRAEGTLLYRDVIDREAPQLIPEAFFLQRDMLCYVRDRRLLIAVRLREFSP